VPSLFTVVLMVVPPGSTYSDGPLPTVMSEAELANTVKPEFG
jgi:hypothetical protein